MDPLDLLRDVVTQGRLSDVAMDDKEVRFGAQYAFPR